MPRDGTINDIEADFEILEAIGAHVDDLIDRHAPGGAIQKTLRRWLTSRAPAPDEGAGICLMAMAADLELFTPSMSGRTAVERFVEKTGTNTPVERQALNALGSAQFRLIRIIGREGPDLVRLKDLVTGEGLTLLDARLSPDAAGLATAMRLCPLVSGRQVLISPLFAADEVLMTSALTFARAGRPLGHGHRCAATLYRDVARQGVVPLPQNMIKIDEGAVRDAFEEVEVILSPVARLALRWSGEDGANEAADLVPEARRLASADNLVDACGLFAQAQRDAPRKISAALERIADLQMETLSHRARASVGGYAAVLEGASAAIANHVARGEMHREARDLFQRLRTRWSVSAAGPAETASSATNLDRVIQRIRALRAKTVDQGCTEAEAMAAAAKVAELLDRYDLTLDEVSVRQSPCEGASVATGRKRRAPVDTCLRPLAEFCDCQVWSEEGDDSGLRYVFFGLRADVEAARFLYDLIELTFETESATFRRSEIYRAHRGGDRRIAQNSFQVGLARGINAKLASLKASRQSHTSGSTGFNLVAAKQSVVDEEIARLGLNFITRSASSRRHVHHDSYAAGEAAGALFEPSAALAGERRAPIS